MKKKLFALATACLMLSLVFAGCNSPKETSSVVESQVEEQQTGEPAETGITAGIYEYIMTPEGREAMQNYFHFYPNGAYYLSTYNGGQYEAGFYAVVDEPIDFIRYDVNVDGEEDSAPQTLVLFDLSGTETGRYGFDGDTVYSYTPFHNNHFIHIPDADHDPADESGVTIEEFMLEDDIYSTVQLNHNGSFQDSIRTILDGTWEKDGDMYYLTEEDSGEVYTLKVDGNEALYTGLDGEEFTLVRVQEAVVQLVLSGSGEGDYGEVDASVLCYDDGSAELVVGISGNTNTSTGTWAMADDYSQIVLELEGETYEAAMDYESQTFSFEMELAGANILFTSGDAAAELQLTFVGEENDNVRLEMYSDGTCALIYEGMGTVSEGTWTMDTSGALPAFGITLENGGEMVVESDYATKFFFAYENEGGTLQETLALSFDDLGAALG